MENVEVRIKDAVWLGFCIGLGIGLALTLYGLIVLLIVKGFIQAALQ